MNEIKNGSIRRDTKTPGICTNNGDPLQQGQAKPYCHLNNFAFLDKYIDVNVKPFFENKKIKLSNDTTQGEWTAPPYNAIDNFFVLPSQNPDYIPPAVKGAFNKIRKQNIQ